MTTSNSRTDSIGRKSAGRTQLWLPGTVLAMEASMNRSKSLCAEYPRGKETFEKSSTDTAAAKQESQLPQS